MQDPPGGEPCEEAPGGRAGWLSKRAHFTLRWRPTWFHLEGGRLLYGESDQGPVKTIPLVGARVSGSGDPLGWTITPQGATRSYHLRAASAAEQQSWLRGICDAQVASAQHGTRACVVQ